MLKYIYHFNFMHLRTKRKPTHKNLSKLIFSIILAFVMIGIIFSLGNIKKDSFGFKSTKQEDQNKIATSTASTTTSLDPIKASNSNTTEEYWTLNVESVLTTKVGEQIFIEIASTSEKQERGLSGKSKLMEFIKDQKIRTEGMLFVFDKAQTLNFWMKDMNFDLDMVWLDENFKIVHITKNALASSYNRQNPASSTIFTNGKNLAKYVLEINSGLSNELNLREGDILIIQ